MVSFKYGVETSWSTVFSVATMECSIYEFSYCYIILLFKILYKYN
ncbi:hypothetical protein [Methanobrevibacter arboriphilus]|nr:hypothetical protein [Methanobrevibacter arboriphilus]